MFRDVPKNLPDYNRYYGIKPFTKGVMIKETSPPEVALSSKGRMIRSLSTTGKIVTSFDDPFYFGQELWMAAVEVAGLRTSYSPGEVVKLTVGNIDDHAVSLLPGADMVYRWKSPTGEIYIGVAVELPVSVGLEYWEVWGESPIYGSTMVTPFSITTDPTALPIPQIQTLTGTPGGYSNYTTLNREYYNVATTELEWAELSSSVADYTTDIESFTHSFDSVPGISYLKVRAVKDGTIRTPWTTVSVISVYSPKTVRNNLSAFTPVNPITKVNLSTSSVQAMLPGATIYFKVLPQSSASSNDSDEITVLSVENGKVLNPGIFRTDDLIKIQLPLQLGSYSIKINYLYRRKGTTGGIVKEYSYATTISGSPEFTFDIDIPRRMAANEVGLFTVGDENCVPLGAYTFSIDSNGVTLLGLSGDATTKRTVSPTSTIPYTVQSNSGTANIEFTFYNLVGDVVATQFESVQVVSGISTFISVTSTTDPDIFTTYSGSQATLLYRTVGSITGTTLGINPDTVKVYDIADINNPHEMLKSIGGYEFTGSEEYPQEFYRALDISAIANSGANPLDSLGSIRRFDLDILPTYGELTNVSSRVSSNGASGESKYQHIIPSRTGDGGVIAYDAAGDTLSGTVFAPLTAFIASKLTNSPGGYRAYIVGPNLEILLIFSRNILPITRGRTIITYTEAAEVKSVLVDPDNTPSDSNLFERIKLDAFSDFQIKALSYGAVVTLTD